MRAGARRHLGAEIPPEQHTEFSQQDCSACGRYHRVCRESPDAMYLSYFVLFNFFFGQMKLVLQKMWYRLSPTLQEMPLSPGIQGKSRCNVPLFLYTSPENQTASLQLRRLYGSICYVVALPSCNQSEGIATVLLKGAGAGIWRGGAEGDVPP